MRFSRSLLLGLVFVGQAAAFAPSSFITNRISQNVGVSRVLNPNTDLNMMMDASAIMDTTSQMVNTMGTNPMLSFADQGQNLAGIFFQASLLPYLFFLYFLQFRGNRTPDFGNFGFQFVLLFVAATIPSGIIARATYGCSLADADWLHGGAEALLTTANILLVSCRHVKHVFKCKSIAFETLAHNIL